MPITKQLYLSILKLALIFLLTSCNGSATAKSNCPDSAQQFWKNFRTAVIKNDTAAIAGMTQFPFILSIGVMDEDRKNLPLQRDKFVTAIPKLLSDDSGMSETPTSMQQYAKSLDMVPSKFCSADGKQFRVGDWVFQLKQENWKFIQTYMDDDFQI